MERTEHQCLVVAESLAENLVKESLVKESLVKESLVKESLVNESLVKLVKKEKVARVVEKVAENLENE